MCVPEGRRVEVVSDTVWWWAAHSRGSNATLGRCVPNQMHRALQAACAAQTGSADSAGGLDG
jgi:hypothetical protein